MDVNTLDGISVPEIDWKPLIKDLNPKLDPLASLIPADQHVVFFPSFAAAILTADQAEIQGTPILHLAEPRSEDAMTAKRYQRQLCLSLTGFGRLLGPKVVSSVALTGSDPYFRTGTDVAVVFGAADPKILEGMLLTQISMAAANEPQIKPEQGEIEGLKYHGVKTPDRAVCSYVARLDGAVVVTNSLYQLGRLAAVANKKSAAIASLSEYIFFRDRYKLGDPDETALVFLSDPTIRRWCGPRWRIATSRQTRDMAVLAELQAANVDRLVKKTAQPGPIYSDFATVDVGDLSLDPQGVHSTVQGSLAFMTPIAELPMTKVTKAEAEAYRWCARVISRIGVGPSIRSRSGVVEAGAAFGRSDGDAADLRHPLPRVHFDFAGWEVRSRRGRSAQRPLPLHPGHQSKIAHVHSGREYDEHNVAGRDPRLARLIGGLLCRRRSGVAGSGQDSPGQTLRVHAQVSRSTAGRVSGGSVERIPAGRFPCVGKGLHRADRAGHARLGIVEVQRSTLREDHADRKGQGRCQGAGKSRRLLLGLRQSAAGDAQRRSDETRDRPATGPGGKGTDQTSPSPIGKPWLGSNVGLHVDRKALDIVGILSREDRQIAMQMLSWGNLPILNQWKRHVSRPRPGRRA